MDDCQLARLAVVLKLRLRSPRLKCAQKRAQPILGGMRKAFIRGSLRRASGPRWRGSASRRARIASGGSSTCDHAFIDAARGPDRLGLPVLNER